MHAAGQRATDPFRGPSQVAAASPQVQLLTLAEVGGVRALVEREIKAMPITVNIEDIPLLREPIDRAHAKGRSEGLAEGVAKGRAAAIERLLRRKFLDVPAGWPSIGPISRRTCSTRSSTIARPHRRSQRRSAVTRRKAE